MTFHPEALAQTQQKVLRDLAPWCTRRGFYLAGGTAIALHLGHRRSIDFDWFSETGMADALRLAQDLRTAGLDFVTERAERDTLHGTISGVWVSFLGYRYPLLQPLVAWPAYGCELAALDDLACMKLAAIAQRGAKKDFVDLYALGTRHRPLHEMLDLYREKYEVEDIGHLLVALAYFEDADAERMPNLLWNVRWDAVKQAVRGWVKEIAR